MVNTHFLKRIVTIIFFAAGFHSANAGASDTITFAWQWNAGGTGYVSGPNGDIAFHLYMRTEDDAEYDFEYPAIEGIDNCWIENDLYYCQTTLTHAFEPGIRYFFSVAAYLVNDSTSVSTLSNEIAYAVALPDEKISTVDDVSGHDDPVDTGQDNADADSSTSEGGGGGCFIASSLIPFTRTQ